MLLRGSNYWFQTDITLGGFQQYKLVDQLPLSAAALQPADNAVYPIVVGNTPALIVAMGRDSGGLTLSLTDPTGRAITPTTSDPAIFYNSTAMQTLYAVANPQPSNWTVTVGNRIGSEHYLLSVVGAPVTAAISQSPVLTSSGAGYAITIQATGAPTATYSLFYDDDATGYDGKPIATDIALSQTSVSWNTSTVPQGIYYVYALLDDAFHAPVFAYSAVPVTISDSIPPATPTGLRVSSMGSVATIFWAPNSAPDVAGYRIYYREPGGATFAADIPNNQQSSYTQSGLYLNGGWEIAVNAYDLSGNESTRSAAVVATVYLNNIYLPLVLTNQ